jgi:hypothetical protein
VVSLDINGRNPVVKRHVIALLGALAVLLALGSGVAQAQSVQGVDQTALTGQSASSTANSTQTNPSNSNISVRIFSPGSAGSVSQSNTSAAGAAAINKAATVQGAAQSQSGSGEQGVGQTAGTGQKADATANSTQDHPKNSNISVRIYSPGSDGDVSQSNNSVAGAIAGNKAATEQGVEQNQGGGDKCGCHGSGNGVQAVGQEAGTLQGAKSNATSEQSHPSNSNISVRIGSPDSDKPAKVDGGSGSVNQSNNSGALSVAGNHADTTQMVGQSQDGCGCGGDRVQAVGQKAITGQWSDANATSKQKGASNSNTPVRIDSPGSDGDVTQSNKSVALAAAVNAAKTVQGVEQFQDGGCGCREPKDHGSHGGGAGAGVQAVGQFAATLQKAGSNATSEQWYPSNSNAPVRDKKSPGGGGSVDQSNTSLAGALSLNLAGTLQWVRQEQ